MAYQSLTLAQLRARLEARVESVPFWVDAEANDAINEALLTWGMLTGRWKTRVVLATTPGTVDYALPSAMTYRMRVAFNGHPLSPSALADLDLGRPDWRTETTADGGSVPSRPTLWAPLSLNLIYIWPADAAGGNSLVVDGVATTPVLTADGQYVDLAEADISTLLGFALHVLTYKKGGPWFAATQGLFRAFVEAAAAENSLITTTQWYRRFAGLDMRDLQPVSNQPSSVGQLVPGGGA